jgi:hypothetical protein
MRQTGRLEDHRNDNAPWQNLVRKLPVSATALANPIPAFRPSTIRTAQDCRSPAPLSLFLMLLAILEIGQPPIFICHAFQPPFGRFMRRKGCLSATDAFKRSEALLFHSSETDDCQFCSQEEARRISNSK